MWYFYFGTIRYLLWYTLVRFYFTWEEVYSPLYRVEASIDDRAEGELNCPLRSGMDHRDTELIGKTTKLGPDDPLASLIGLSLGTVKSLFSSFWVYEVVKDTMSFVLGLDCKDTRVLLGKSISALGSSFESDMNCLLSAIWLSDLRKSVLCCVVVLLVCVSFGPRVERCAELLTEALLSRISVTVVAAFDNCWSNVFCAWKYKPSQTLKIETCYSIHLSLQNFQRLQFNSVRKKSHGHGSRLKLITKVNCLIMFTSRLFSFFWPGKILLS